MSGLSYKDIENSCKRLTKDMNNFIRLGYKKTKKGLWAASVISDVYEAFRWVNLEDYHNFVDLGSGDGRVVAVASLFTRATGIEIDPDLYRLSIRLRKSLNLKNVEFYNDDFENRDLNQFDFIYMYPDNPNIRIGTMLEKTWKGTIMIAGSHFEPPDLRKVGESRFGIERFVLYEL